MISRWRQSRTSERTKNRRWQREFLVATLAFIVFGLLAALYVSTRLIMSPDPSLTIPLQYSNGMSDPTGWMSAPIDGPGQTEHGALLYWEHCMACHGDRGQGLASFRSSYPPADQNCSSTRCHGGPRPGAGFSFPDAPAIKGPGTLSNFVTAADLFAFVSKRMPFQAPGTLTGDEYWDLVAFILDQHNVLPNGLNVGPSNAGSVLIHPHLEQRNLAK